MFPTIAPYSRVQDEPERMKSPTLHRSSPCSSLHSLYSNPTPPPLYHEKCGDEPVSPLRRVKNFYRPRRPTFAVAVAIPDQNDHRNRNSMEVTIRTQDYVINVEIPLYARPESVPNNCYSGLGNSSKRAELELECPECDEEFDGEGGVGDLATHFNEVHWGRRVERKRCRKGR
ncbi:hypothetical protein ACMFMG_001275 [Clarireedia jacksonii]